jgi:conjugative transfer signal peptidase TraF
MTKRLSPTHCARIQQLGVLFACLMLVVFLLMFSHLTVNLTPSMPIGVYRLLPMDRPIARGDIVEICPPLQVVDILLGEGKTHVWNPCDRGVSPLLKFVAAVGGNIVDLSDKAVVVNGVPLPGSATLPPRERHHTITQIARGRYVLRVGQLWLWTPYARSWDSRYFGPVPSVGVRGFARPVFVWDSGADWRDGIRSLASVR